MLFLFYSAATFLLKKSLNFFFVSILKTVLKKTIFKSFTEKKKIVLLVKYRL